MLPYLFDDVVPISPSNTEDTGIPSQETGGLYVTGTGNLVVVTLSGNTRTLAAVPAGTYIPLRVKRVVANGTTATGILIFRGAFLFK